MQILNRLSLFCLLLTLSACAKGPSDTLQLAAKGLLCGDIANDGQLAVVGAVHHGGSLWDINNNERVFDWNHKSGAYSSLRACALSGDGKTAVTTEENTLVVWNTMTGKSKGFWQASDRILSIKLNWKGDRALIGTSKGEASLFNLVKGGAIHTFQHNAEIRDVDMDRDGRIGMTASDDKTAKIWDLRTGKELRSFTLENFIKTIALSDSGKLAFITAQREDAIVLNIESGDELFNLNNRYTNYTAADFSEDEAFLDLGSFQGEIKRWEIASGNEVAAFKAKPRQAYGSASSKAILSLVDQGGTILALSSDGVLQRFQLQ